MNPLALLVVKGEVDFDAIDPGGDIVVVEQLEIDSTAYLNLSSSGKGGEHVPWCRRQLNEVQAGVSTRVLLLVLGLLWDSSLRLKLGPVYIDSARLHRCVRQNTVRPLAFLVVKGEVDFDAVVPGGDAVVVEQLEIDSPAYLNMGSSG